MKRAVDLAALWIYCMVAAVFMPVCIPFVTAALAAVVYACGACLTKSGKGRFGMTVAFLAFSSVCRQFLIFAPLALYTLLDVVQPHAFAGDKSGILGDTPCGAYWGCGIVDTRRYVLGLAIGGLCVSFYLTSDGAFVYFAGAGCVIAALLEYQTGRYGLLDAKYRKTRDDSAEKNMLLREKNQSILKKQDYEVYTATLKERNRIAREIHDNVGHMLSRSILMVGAMKTVHGEGNLKEPLCRLEDTLNAAMSSVRESVHDLHDEAINLKEALEDLIEEYTFCQARLAYDCGYDVPREIRYGFIAIVKESLNNVMKHSNATWVRVVAREHPGLYQLIIEDNGTTGTEYDMMAFTAVNRTEDGAGTYTEGMQAGKQGIGIRNMKERVDAFGGNLEIRTQKGWRIYVTVPKRAGGS